MEREGQLERRGASIVRDEMRASMFDVCSDCAVICLGAIALVLAVLAGKGMVRMVRNKGALDSRRSMDVCREREPDKQDPVFSRARAASYARKDGLEDNAIPAHQHRSLVRRSLHTTKVLEGPAQAGRRCDSPERSLHRSPERSLISPEEALGRLAKIERQYGDGRTSAYTGTEDRAPRRGQKIQRQ
jgi:hypothetical protein